MSTVPQLDDLRRPRRARRLEHLARVARRTCSAPTGGRSASSAACRRTGCTSTSATSPPPNSRRTSCTSRCAPHGGDVEPLLREFAAARRRRGRRREGHPLVLPPRLRAGPAADDRLAVRAHPRRRRAQHGQRGRVRLDRPSRSRASYDHLLIGTSLPWLLRPRTARPRGVGRGAVPTARAARGWPASASGCAAPADLEHWAAFRQVVRAAGRRCIAAVGRARPDAPATICVLSGDVHHAYVAEAHFAAAGALEGLPADLLAAAQLRPVVHEDRLPGLLEPARRALRARCCCGWSRGCPSRR